MEAGVLRGPGNAVADGGGDNVAVVVPADSCSSPVVRHQNIQMAGQQLQTRGLEEGEVALIIQQVLSTILNAEIMEELKVT